MYRRWWLVLALLTVVSYMYIHILSVLFVGFKVQKQVAGIATPGFDDCLAQTANDHPVTCRLPFAASLETEVHPHGRAAVWLAHNALCTAFITHLVVAQSGPRGTLNNENGLPVCAITAYCQYQYSVCIMVY